MNTRRDLKPNEVEIVWIGTRGNDGAVEYIQADKVAFNGLALVCDLRGHQIVIPLTSIRRFRVKAQ